MKESGYMLSWRTTHLTGQWEGPFTEELQPAQGELLGSSSQVAGNKGCCGTEINPELLSVRSSNPSRECPVRVLKPNCKGDIQLQTFSSQHWKRTDSPKALKRNELQTCTPLRMCPWCGDYKSIVPPLVLANVPHTQATKPVSSALYSSSVRLSIQREVFRSNRPWKVEKALRVWSPVWLCVVKGPMALDLWEIGKAFPSPRVRLRDMIRSFSGPCVCWNWPP